jgi:hypothetical protein
MAFGDEDLCVFFSDFAVPLVFNGVAAKGLVDSYDQDLSPNGVSLQGRVTDVTLPSSAWSPFPKQGATVTVDGKDMKVRDIAQEKDGAISHLYMVKP